MCGMGFWRALSNGFQSWQEPRPFRMAAALAYYSLYSLLPLLLIGNAISSLVFGEQAAQGDVSRLIEDLVGPKAAAYIEWMLKDALTRGSHTPIIIVGLAFLGFGASALFLELQDSLNTIWKVTPTDSGVLALVRCRLLSFAVVLGIGFILVTDLVVGYVVIAVVRSLDAIIVASSALPAVHMTLSLVLVAALFVLVHKLLLDIRVRWRYLLLGALLTSLLYLLGRYALCFYVKHGFVGSANGGIGSLVIVLSWVYYSSPVFLLGGQLLQFFSLFYFPPPDIN